jgi:hypothetical protein
MSKLFWGSYFNVLHRDLFICFVFSHPSQTSSTNLFPFDLTLMQVFKNLLGPSFYECANALLVHRQVILPILMEG